MPPHQALRLLSLVGLGATAYNQTLLQRRADALKDYLVNSGGLDAAKVEVAGTR